MKGPTNASARPNIRLLNVSVTFDDNPDTSNNTEFPYRATIQADGVSEYMSATVMFSQVQAISGNFATYCQTDEDVIYIYAKTNPTPNEGDTITIPAVSCDLSVNYINVDNVPTEDSQAVITSGGVYDALAGKVNGSGNIGSDTKPIKIVNGVATAVANDFVTVDTVQTITGSKTYSTAILFNDSEHSIGKYLQSTYSSILLSSQSPNKTTSARLYIRANNDGTVNLILGKWLNGSYTSTTIGSL